MTKDRIVAFELPFLEARRMKDPFNEGVFTHIFYVDTRRLPALPNEANARSGDSRINNRVYKGVGNSAMAGRLNPDDRVTPGLFGHKHLGINVIAQRVIQKDPHTALIEFRANADDEIEEGGDVADVGYADGVVNGGHGVEVLRRLQEKYGFGNMPPEFIRVHVTTGLPPECVAEIAGANNASIQVQQRSLLDLDNLFEPIKRRLKGTSLDGNLAYSESDLGDVSVIDLIAVMTCFRSDAYPTSGPNRRAPIAAYSEKSKTLAEFQRDTQGYYDLLPILPQILELTDYIRSSGQQFYNDDGKFKYGSLKFVDRRGKNEGPFTLPFTGIATDYRMNMAAVFPIIAAFRACVQRAAEDLASKESRPYAWCPDFEVVRKIWEDVATEVITSTKEACADKGYSLTSLGKSRSHWANLERIIEVALLRRAA